MFKLSIPDFGSDNKAEIYSKLELVKKYFTKADGPDSDYLDVLNVKLFLSTDYNSTSQDDDDLLGLMINKFPLKFDEVDIAVLYAAYISKNFDSFTASEKENLIIEYLNSDMNFIFNNTSLNKQELTSLAEQEIKKKFSLISAKYFEEIQAKLAYLELLACIHNSVAICSLISIRPSYLHSSIITNWMLHQNYLYKFAADDTVAQSASRKLDMLFGSIKIDKRKFKTRDYLYWRSVFYFENTKAVIDAVRKMDGIESSENCKGVLLQAGISELFFPRVFDKTQSIAQIAVDVSISQKLVKSEKALADIKERVNPLIRLHPDATNDPFIRIFLDFPNQIRSSIEHFDLWSILET